MTKQEGGSDLIMGHSDFFPFFKAMDVNDWLDDVLVNFIERKSVDDSSNEEGIIRFYDILTEKSKNPDFCDNPIAISLSKQNKTTRYIVNEFVVNEYDGVFTILAMPFTTVEELDGYFVMDDLIEVFERTDVKEIIFSVTKEDHSIYTSSPVDVVVELRHDMVVIDLEEFDCFRTV